MLSRWGLVVLGCACLVAFGCTPTTPTGDTGNTTGGTGGGGTGGGTGGGGTGGGGSGSGGTAGGGTGGGGTGGGSSATWQQSAKLVAPDAAAQDLFGTVVAISGDAAIVGASNHSGRTGTAYLYARSGSSWTLQSEVTASDAATASDFGIAVAISGDTAVSGASGAGNLSTFATQSGAAYVFQRAAGIWTQQRELTAANAQSFDYFGSAVAIDGDTAVVGAPGRQQLAGTAYAFLRAGETWAQQVEFVESDRGGTDWFGSAVAISGDTAVIGAHVQNSGTGAVYVYARAGAVWTQQKKLIAPDGAQTDNFGQAVAISEDTVVVGAPGKNTQSGGAYVFVRSGATWSLQQTLASDDQTFGREFGYAVGVDGDTIAVGAPKSSTVFVFVRSGTTWTHQQALVPAQGEFFGISVGISQSTIVGGANGNNDGGLSAGAAYIFQQ